jgi:hypothetical protein
LARGAEVFFERLRARSGDMLKTETAPTGGTLIDARIAEFEAENGE